MGSQGSGGNERLRTVWTPEMDRYFIDLMLEQVRKGNRFEDHLFSKRAWKYMSSLFTMKFKSPYGKDVLKNRHKTLRNLYKAVKNLLDQSGFSWDERRQMVIADNDVWDEYLKIRPDARSFRIKSIPHYHDLCLIYGDGRTEQKGSSPNQCKGATVASTRVNAAVDVGTEVPIKEGEDYRFSESIPVDDPSNPALIPKGNTRSRTAWYPPMDRYFIDLMLDQVRRGNQIEGVFRRQGWTEMITMFNAKFKFDYDVEILKNRYKTLRRQYNVIKNLLRSDGFVWDDARQMVTADDCVWQDYIKDHRDARQFMARPIPYYKDLCLICGDTDFDENDCFVAVDWFDMETDFEEQKSHEPSNDIQSPLPSSPTALNEGVDDNTLLLESKNKRERFDTDTNPTNWKKPRAEDESEIPGASCSLIEKAVVAVQELPEMDDELILDAADLLVDEVQAKTFLALDIKLRKKWLLRKLRPKVT